MVDLFRQKLGGYLEKTITQSVVNSLESLNREIPLLRNAVPINADDINPKKYQMVPALLECKEHRFCTSSDHVSARV